MLSDSTRGYGPHQTPLQIAILDALVDGAATSADVAERTGASTREVDVAIGWAAGQSLLTRLPLPDGELLTLTRSGLAHIALERRMREVVGPEGALDALEPPSSAVTRSADSLLPSIDIAATFKNYRLLATLVLITVLVVALTSFLS